jgi:predicted ribosomally synthesized peptide with nif11-like leader
MSSESFRKFMEKVEHDAGLRQELQARSGEFGMPVEAVVAFAATKGYSFKAEDVSTELTGTPLAPFKGELSEASLKTIAGGADPPEPIMPAGLSTYLSDGRLMFKFH